MSGSAQRDLEARIVEFGEAWARGDHDALAEMLSPSYTHTNVWGELQDRDAWLQYARGRSGATTTFGFADVVTRFVGETAIVTGRNDIVGGNIALRDGRSDRSLRFTQVWVRRDGTWLREAFQATFISG